MPHDTLRGDEHQQQDNTSNSTAADDMSTGGLSPTALLLLRSEQPLLFARQQLSRQMSDDGSVTPSAASQASSSSSGGDASPAAGAEAMAAHDPAIAYDYDTASSVGDTTTGSERMEVAVSPIAAAIERGSSFFRRSGSSSAVDSSPSAPMTFPPSPPSLTGRSESMSALAPTKESKTSGGGGGSALRIFSSPADELAMKAILSPPHLRATSSTGKLADANGANNSNSTPPSGSAAAVTNANGGRNAFTATAAAFEATSTNIFEQGAKLLFRGGSSAAAAVTANKASSGSIVEEDLAKLNNNILVSHPTLPPPPFANMFACDNCREDIGTLLSKGRHHCRNCGGSFCADCSSKFIIVPFQVYLTRGEQRVCDGCYHRIKDFQGQAQSTQVTWSGLQPPQSDVFTQDFELPRSEAPVTIFNCSLFMDFSPFYGHLFLTREHLCFKGYKGHKIKIPFAKIVSLIKPQFYYINALQVKTRRREKFFFAEFNGLRDLAFLRMDQLIRAYQEGKKQFVQVSPDDLVQQAMVRRKSYKLLVESSSGSSATSGPKSTSFMSPAARKHEDLDNFLSGKSTVGYIDIDEESDEDGGSGIESSSSHVSRSRRESHATNRSSVLDDDSEDKKSSASDEEVFEPLPPDVPLQKTTLLLDCELRADVKDVFDLLWNDGIGQQFLFGSMEKARDIDIVVDKWQGITSENEQEVNRGFMISKENNFTLHRVVKSQHPPRTSFPGLPQYATCNRVQRFRLEKSSNGGERWDRFVISDILRMAQIPFSDYFEIETRWVFSRDGKNYCHVQAGLNVNFLKSTWFKSQINSSTCSESKEVLEKWAKQAIEHLKEHERDQRVTMGRPVADAHSGAETVANDDDQVSGDEKRYQSEEAPVSPRSPRVVEGLRRRSMSHKSEYSSHSTAAASVSGGEPGAYALSMRQFLEAGSPPLVQWLVVLVLLYCLMLIRFQQNQIHQLTATTNVLLERLLQQQQQTGSTLTAASAAGSVHEVCQQRMLEGASEALRQFFERAQTP